MVLIFYFGSLGREKVDNKKTSGCLYGRIKRKVEEMILGLAKKIDHKAEWP